MMGVWFATTLPGDILAGFLGGFWSGMAKPSFFVMIALVAALASAGLCAAGLPFEIGSAFSGEACPGLDAGWAPVPRQNMRHTPVAH